MEHFDPYKTPACGQPLLSAERKASSVGRSIHSTAESYRPGSDAYLAIDLVLRHYPTARGTMRAFPNRRRQAWLLVMPGPVRFSCPRADQICSLSGLRRTIGPIICPVACDIDPTRNIYSIEVSDLKAFRFLPVFNFALLGHVSGRFACLRTVGAGFAW